jgi:hypothetical protein
LTKAAIFFVRCSCRRKFLQVSGLQWQLLAAEFLEELFPAAKYDHLDYPGRHIQNIKHQLIRGSSEKTRASSRITVAGRPLLDQHFCEGQPNQNRNLLLGSHTQMVEGFLVSGRSDHCRYMKVFVNRDVGARKQESQIRPFRTGDKYLSLASRSS